MITCCLRSFSAGFGSVSTCKWESRWRAPSLSWFTKPKRLSHTHPSFSQCRASGNPERSSCQRLMSYTLGWADWDWCQEWFESLLPPKQHGLLRLNAFMLTAVLHQSLKQPWIRILLSHNRVFLASMCTHVCMTDVWESGSIGAKVGHE